MNTEQNGYGLTHVCGQYCPGLFKCCRSQKTSICVAILLRNMEIRDKTVFLGEI